MELGRIQKIVYIDPANRPTDEAIASLLDEEAGRQLAEADIPAVAAGHTDEANPTRETVNA